MSDDNALDLNEVAIYELLMQGESPQVRASVRLEFVRQLLALGRGSVGEDE